MKYKILSLFFLFSTVGFANEFQNNLSQIHGNIILKRGEEQFRQNVILKNMGINGISNSNQYIEYVGESHGNYDYNTKYSKVKGVLLGTNSNLVKHPNVYAGISLGYIKSDIKIGNSSAKIRTYGFEYLVGKKYHNFLTIGKFGYSESKNIFSEYKYRQKDYHLGVESGYIYNTNTFALYPYISLNWNQYTTKQHIMVPRFDQKVFYTGAGINVTKILKHNFIISGTLEYNYEVPKTKYRTSNTTYKKLDNSYAHLNLTLGYLFKNDLMLSATYRKLFNNKYDYNIFSVGISHNF